MKFHKDKASNLIKPNLFILAMIFISSSFLYSPALYSENLFNTREIRNTNMKAFDKWASLWRRYHMPEIESLAENNAVSTIEKISQCPLKGRMDCRKTHWQNFIQDTRKNNLSHTDLAKAVNQYMNETRYILDPVNWGLPDYWATPDEFFLKDGDCEDYAISKYITLKLMGLDPEIMRVVVVQDENLRIPHAVLALYLEDQILILDNQVNQILTDKDILHYRPVYSINETAWWLHQKQRFGR